MEEHNEIIYDNLASNINKRDTLFLLGDIAFDLGWHQRIAEIRCKNKVLILGNHDTDRSVKVREFTDCYDKVHGLLSHRNYWWSHCPIHPQELRERKGNIHGHLHGNHVMAEEQECFGIIGEHTWQELDTRYINACVEHTDFKPVSFEELVGE
jgi:calcineurin-like phosphoesterase family protein